MKTDINGSKHWYLNNKRHREGGPAVELSDGTRHWLLNGIRHREDGPAVEFSSGNKRWFLNGTQLFTAKEYQQEAGISGTDMTALILKHGPI